MHIARYNILKNTSTERSGHILFETKLKLIGLEVLIMGQENTPFKGFAWGWS